MLYSSPFGLVYSPIYKTSLYVICSGLWMNIFGRLVKTCVGFSIEHMVLGGAGFESDDAGEKLPMLAIVLLS